MRLSEYILEVTTEIVPKSQVPAWYNKRVNDKREQLISQKTHNPIKTGISHGMSGLEYDNDKDRTKTYMTALQVGKGIKHINDNKGKYIGAGLGLGAVAGGAAYLQHYRNKQAISKRNKAIAGASLAAIGAGVGAKALMKYLKKKKKG